MTDRGLGFGIVGCGVISNFHAAALAEVEGACLIGATDVVEGSRKAFAKRHGIRAFCSVDELLADPAIDVVCVCTPTGLHAPQSIQAAKAGKHVVAEKPMALTVAQADDVIQTVESAGVTMAVISQLRFSKAIQQLKGAVENGRLGKLVCGDVYMKFYRSQEYYDSGGWRGTWEMDGGGALMNQGIHGIDVLQYIMGPVKSIYAHARTLVRDIEVEDTSAALLEYENGALGVIQGTTSVFPGLARRLEINGDKGSITVEEDTITKWEIEGEPVPEDVTVGTAGAGSASDPLAISHKGHVLQISDLVKAVRENRKPLVDQHEGRKPIEIIMGIYESAKTGRLVQL